MMKYFYLKIRNIQVVFTTIKVEKTNSRKDNVMDKKKIKTSKRPEEFQHVKVLSKGKMKKENKFSERQKKYGKCCITEA